MAEVANPIVVMKRVGLKYLISPEQADFFRGGDAIVSETALGNPKSVGSNHYGHSAVFEAVSVADAARIPRMFCIHLIPSRLKDAVAGAQALRQSPFTAEYPEPYREYVL